MIPGLFPRARRRAVRRALLALLVLSALPSFALDPSSARACFCNTENVADACAGRGGSLFFTGRVESVRVEGRNRIITVAVVRAVRAPGRTVVLTVGTFGEYLGEITTCDPEVPALTPGTFVRVIARSARLSACDRVVVLPSRAAARRDPCGR